MSHERDSELLRLWGSAGVPVEDPEVIAERRERTVALLEKTLREGAARRQQRERRSATGRGAVVALAASAVLAIGAFVAWRVVNPAVVTSAASFDESAGAVPEVRVVFGRFTREGRVLESGGTVAVGVSLATNTGAAGQLAIGAVGEGSSGSSRGASWGSASSGSGAFRTGGAARVDVAGGAQLTVTKLAALERRVALSAGRVDVEVTPDTVRRKFVVETPDAEVVVKGTVFSVSVEHRPNGTSATRIGVSRGEVEVDVRGRAVATLRAGQTWSSESGIGAGGAPSAKTNSDVSRVDSRPDGHSLDVRGDVIARRSAQGPATARAGAASRDAAASELPGTLPPGTLPPGTLAAENALFASAVDARNRGDDAQASELFGRFVSRYSRSPLRQEAEVEAFRALQRQGRTAEAASRARRYLRDHEQGFARAEARELLLNPSSKP